mgnify:CR=1 FL=1
MKNNAATYEHFIGLVYAELPFYLAEEVRLGVHEGYLRIREGIIRAA